MKTFLIYKATNILNGKVYVGYTNSNKGFKRRKYEHYHGAFLHTKGRTSKFYNALKKYPDDFKWVIIEEGIKTMEEAKIAEINWISHYNSYKTGYNSTIGGDGGGTNSNRIYTHKYDSISQETIKYVIDSYISGVGKAEIVKNSNLSYNMIRVILENNNVEKLPPLNQRNKKELVENEYIEPSTKSICKVGEKNPKYVHLTFEQRKEIAEAYSIKKMKKNSILVHFNIGGRILNRILKEFSVQKNIPKYKQNEKI